MVIVGLDPSLTSFGVAVAGSWNGPGKGWATHRLTSKPPKTPGVAARIERYLGLLSELTELLDSYQPSLVLIENYAFGAQGQAVTNLAEFGGLLRADVLATPGVEEVYEVAPTTLKKFVTGKGNSDKAAMIAKISQQFQIDSPVSEDEYEALGLVWLGGMARGLFQLGNTKQQGAIKTIFGDDWQKAILAGVPF